MNKTLNTSCELKPSGTCSSHTHNRAHFSSTTEISLISHLQCPGGYILVNVWPAGQVKLNQRPLKSITQCSGPFLQSYYGHACYSKSTQSLSLTASPSRAQNWITSGPLTYWLAFSSGSIIIRRHTGNLKPCQRHVSGKKANTDKLKRKVGSSKCFANPQMCFILNIQLFVWYYYYCVVV